MIRKFLGAAALVLLACATTFAQQTTGSVTGRVVDQQGSAVPGATVTAKSPSTGFTRTEASDAEGLYRLAALPVGIYEVTAELSGFQTVSKKDVEVNVSQIVALDRSILSDRVGHLSRRNVERLLIGIDRSRTHATILGFPRDSWVHIPGFGTSKINSAMVDGGPALMVKTIESITGIPAVFTVFRPP